MAEIRPFRAWRYREDLSQDISSLTSPLFDVVNKRQREQLYKNPYNSIHISVPAGTDPIKNAGSTLKNWKETGTIVQDHLPSIYVYYQYFSLPGSDRVYCRKGFMANIRVYEWDENVILRHENTMPGSVNDRMQILEVTQLNASATHGLYSDPAFQIEHFLDEAIAHPLYETEDYQGVRDVFSVIHDTHVIRRIMKLISNKKIILADGHHRYAGSLEYLRKMIMDNPKHTGSEPYNFHMMWLTNMESDDLRILPTHRIVRGLQTREEDLISKLEEDFNVKSVENTNDIHEIILGKQWAFGLLIGENSYKIRLKPEKISTMTLDLPKVVRELDLTVMHYFVFEKVLGITGEEQRNTPNISFQRNFAECLKEVLRGDADFALITKEISINTVKKVCFSGHTLPQKSTYFYPKVICGFLFSSIHEDEFYSPLDPGI